MTGASLALTATSVVAALGFSRIFADGIDLVPVVVAALAAHAVSQVALRREWGPVLTAAVFLGGLPLLAAWAMAPDTTAYGVPTTGTLGRLGEWLDQGFGRLRNSKVPVREADELVFLAVSACWFGGLAAEWVSFRAGAVLTGVVPAATVFTVTSSLGTDEYEVLLAGAFVAGSAAFVLMQAPHVGARLPWTGADAATLARRRMTLLRAGIPLVAVVAVAAALVGPRLPEARSAGLVDLKEPSSGPRTRFTVSPLIGIRDQLTREPPVDAFTVRARRPAYWRLTALTNFDGDIWSSEGRARGLSSTLPSDGTVDRSRRLKQRFRISGLAQFWLPAAYRPSHLELDDAKFIPDSLTLVTDAETASGLTYTVESRVPAYTADELNQATLPGPESLPEARRLPGSFPDSIRQLAVDVALRPLGDNATPYAAARALQDYFRTQFEYDENAPAGHSLSAMEHFLFVSRSGYCEHFASAFTAMARSLGIPARVAVGFTPGTPDATGAYRVTSEEAHAWPEVFLQPYGWVAFEPTPARHDPSPNNHTGTFSRDAAPRPQPEPEPQATATTVPQQGAGGTTATTAGGGRLDQDEPASPWPMRIAMAAAVLVTAAVAVALAAVILNRRDRQRRRREADTRRAVLAAWEELVERLQDEGVGVEPSRTPAEVAAAAVRRRPDVAEGVIAMSSLVEEAVWSPRPPDAAEVRDAWTAVDTVVGVLDQDVAPRTRLVRVLKSGVAALSRTPRARW